MYDECELREEPVKVIDEISIEQNMPISYFVED